MFSLRGKYVSLHFMWNLVFLSSYHNWPKFPTWGLTIQHRHATLISTSSKRREKIRWWRLFINEGYEGKQKQKLQEIRLDFLQKFNRGSVNNVQYCRAHS